jgi:PTS system nitrogen regulatory IIA component
MKISDFLSPTEVLVNIRAADKQQLLQELARRAAALVNVPRDRIASELLKREELGSTGMGDGVAIPHARFQELKKPFGLLAKLKSPINFDAIDGQPVNLVFILLLPAAAEGEQLGALASVARKLRSGDDLTKIRRAKNASELYTAMID